MEDHGAAIARIEANTDAIVQRLDRLNGTVARHEKRLNEIDQAHAAEAGERRGRGNIGERALMILTCLAAVWAAWSSHIQAVSAAVHK